MSKHRNEENEAVHEHDAFVKLMLGLKDSALAKRQTLGLVIAAAAAALVIIAVVAAINEHTANVRLNVVDSATTIDEMEKAAEEYPNDVGLALKLGQACILLGKEGDLEKAEAHFARAAAAGAGLERAVSALALGKLKTDLGKHEDALKLFEDAAEVSSAQTPTQDEANWYAGRCLEQLGRAEEARERYDRIQGPKPGERRTLWFWLAQFRTAELRRASLE
ncbi:MAG: tetratricopeptide repeat protein [Planctomycetota bacterium]